MSINWPSLVTKSVVVQKIFKSAPMSHVLKLIMMSNIWSIMTWLEIQKLEYLEN